MRLIFMGTPEFARVALAELLAHGHDVVAVYSRAPKPGGRRGLRMTASPVQRLAEDHGLPVLTPNSLRAPEVQEAFSAHRAEAAVVVAYGLLLPRPILEATPLGCLNLHASLLPRWRGAAPIQRAVMAGDEKTGVYVMRLDEGLDTGPLGGEPSVIDIGPDSTAGEIHDKLAPIAARLLVERLKELARGGLAFTPQDESIGATYAPKIDKSERRIDWSLSAREIHNHIRGLSPFPGAVTEAEGPTGFEQIKVLRSHVHDGSGAPGEALDDYLTIACGEGAVRLTQLQRAGRSALPADQFLLGFPVCEGARLR